MRIGGKPSAPFVHVYFERHDNFLKEQLPLSLEDSENGTFALLLTYYHYCEPEYRGELSRVYTLLRLALDVSSTAGNSFCPAFVRQA